MSPSAASPRRPGKRELEVVHRRRPVLGASRGRSPSPARAAPPVDQPDVLLEAPRRLTRNASRSSLSAISIMTVHESSSCAGDELVVRVDLVLDGGRSRDALGAQHLLDLEQHRVVVLEDRASPSARAGRAARFFSAMTRARKRSRTSRTPPGPGFRRVRWASWRSPLRRPPQCTSGAHAVRLGQRLDRVQRSHAVLGEDAQRRESAVGHDDVRLDRARCPRTSFCA